jgi:hypothetical protein
MRTNSYIEPQRRVRQRFLAQPAKFFHSGAAPVAETSTSMSRPAYAFCDNAIFVTRPDPGQKRK